MAELKKFTIYGLWDERNYSLKFSDGKLIMVGENGSGKTTVLRILFNTLGGKWSRLIKENFKKIEIEIGNEVRSFDWDELGDEKNYEFPKELLEELPLFVRRQIDFWDVDNLKLEKVLELFRDRGLVNEYQQIIDDIKRQMKCIPQKMREINEWIEKNLQYQIIYYPTYRRFEAKPDNSLSVHGYGFARRRNENNDYNEKCFEIAHSGMQGVDDIINSNLRRIEHEYNRTSSELNMSCFKGILTQDYENIIKISEEQADSEYIDTVFNSLSNTDLLGGEATQIKDNLLEVLAKSSEYNEYDKIVIYYYNMVAQRFDKLKKAEEKIEQFFYACNKYLNDKRFEYNPQIFKYKIEIVSRNGEKKGMSINQLSSGEKQIVALFCYLYLLDTQPKMIIIDEPELSLSVDWQERILEDIQQGPTCKSLIVATQSPFVYDNSLRRYAHSIEEFLVLE